MSLLHAQTRRLLKFFEPSIRDHPDWPVIMSEGDSWFSFPLHWNTVDHLDSMADRKLSLLRLEQNGDELLSIFGGPQKAKLALYLSRYPVEALLFSGGGNDVVGSNLPALLREKTATMGWEACIRKDRARRKLKQLELAYLELADIRDDHRPGCVVYMNGYDYAVASGKKVKLWGLSLGPWLRPALKEKGIDDPADRQAIIGWLIDEFNATLDDIASQRSDFIRVDTPGALAKTDWNDELHPKRAGFKKIASLFSAQLAQQFPDTF